MAQNLGYEKVWLDKSKYEAAEYEYYESKAKVKSVVFVTPLL